MEVAESGDEALEILEELKDENIEVKVVISDYIMPNMKGDVLLSSIHKRNPEIKTIMLTGQSDIEGVKNDINNANLYRFIEKPWSNEDMFLTIDSAIRDYDQKKEIEIKNKMLKKMNEELEEKIKERTRELELANKELGKLSITDKLTGLYNRTKLDDTLEKEMKGYLRYNHSFSIILIDIDHFKTVNDTYGHKVGDSVLCEIAQVLLEAARENDTVGRWGGEEFLIICPETPLNSSLELAEKIRMEVENFQFTTVVAKTVSICLSEFGGKDTIDKLIERADVALYKAKESGRNRVESL